MSISLPSWATVRSALRVYYWEQVLRRRTHVVVFHVPRGLAWGRRGMRARLLSESPQPSNEFAPEELAVDVRYCPAWCAKKAIENIGGPSQSLAPLFGGFDAVVISGDDAEEVTKVAGKLKKSMGGSRAILVGAKIGDQVISSDQWRTDIEEGPSQVELWANIVGFLSQQLAAPVRVLDESQKGITASLNASNSEIHALLTRHQQSEQSTNG